VPLPGLAQRAGQKVSPDWVDARLEQQEDDTTGQ